MSSNGTERARSFRSASYQVLPLYLALGSYLSYRATFRAQHEAVVLEPQAGLRAETVRVARRQAAMQRGRLEVQAEVGQVLPKPDVRKTQVRTHRMLVVEQLQAPKVPGNVLSAGYFLGHGAVKPRIQYLVGVQPYEP